MTKRKYTTKDRKPVVVIDGDRIRQLRINRNMSRQQLADTLNVHINVVSNVENGRQNMELVSFYNLARALGASTDQLLKEPTCSPMN